MGTATTGKWLGALLVLALFFGALFGGRAWLDERAAVGNARVQPALPVSAAAAGDARWELHVEAIGILRAVQGTAITAQVAGNVTRIGFDSGARARAGEQLVQIDNSTQLAALHSNEAQLRLAALDLERMRALYERRLVSQQELQQAETKHEVAVAAVASDQAVLGKLRISAPFDGVLGIRQVSLGQYVSPGTPIVSLQRWDPILLDFSLPQEQIRRIGTGQPVAFRVDAYPERSFHGKVTAIGAEVDADTRNVAIEATLSNADELLRPGLFGHARLELGETLTGIAVPHTAITYSTFGDTVWLLEEAVDGGSTVHARVVRVLAERDGEALLEPGLIAAGTLVVTAGQNRLREGMAVHVEDGGQP